MMNLAQSGTSILSFIVFLPALGALLLTLTDKNDREQSRSVATLIAFTTFVLSLVLLRDFNNAGVFQFVEKRDWMPSFGFSYIIGVDGLSIWLVVLTTFLTTLVLMASGSIEKKVRSYLGLMLLLETGMLGTLVSLDLISFYIFWELMLVPMYFLIGVWGGERRVYAAIKFVLYTALGSLLMLVAIVYLAFSYKHQFGSWSFLFIDWMRISLSHREEILLFSAFALAFAIKIPVFPLHTWLPDAHVEAPTGGSVILAGVLLKLGLYGLIRFCIPLFPNAVEETRLIFAYLGVIGIVYGALVAWVQTDMKKLVAYSSVSHLGFCVLGYAAMNIQGLQGSILQMLNHGISTAALFFLVGVVYDRRHTRLISEYGGLAAKLPVYAFVFLVFTLSSIGLPLTNGFIGEFLVLLGAFRYQPALAVVSVTGVVLGAMYMLSLYRRVFFGPIDESKNGKLIDLSITERTVFAALALMVFLVGLYPGPLLLSIEPTARRSIEYLEQRTAGGFPENSVKVN